MLGKRFDVLFEEYIRHIILTKAQSDIIDATLIDSLTVFMTAYDGDAEIYAQGSYALGTMVRPLTENQSLDGEAGEFDVDIVIERGWEHTGARAALDSLRTILSREYPESLDAKKHESCERVKHYCDNDTGIQFHSDYVPIKQSGCRKVARRSIDQWRNSDTKAYTEWYMEQSLEKPFLSATVIMLKRMRDYANLTDKLPSICISTLAANYYQDKGSYLDDLLAMIITLAATFQSGRADISAPPFGTENLAEHISPSDQQGIARFFKKCYKELRMAFDVTTPDLCLAQQCLSNSFPGSMDDFPDCLESLRNRGLSLELDGSLETVSLNCICQNRILDSSIRKYLKAGEDLLFKVNQYEKFDGHNYGVRWQVLNSASSPDRRGTLFDSTKKEYSSKKNTNDFQNYEHTQYNGRHWIRCYIYDKSTRKVVAVSQKFYVRIDTGE